MRMSFAVNLLALAAGVLPGHALAEGLKPVSDAILADMRGGFVSAGGLTFDIGITTSTYINGKLAANASIGTSPTAATGPTGPTGPTSPTSPTGPTAPTAPGSQAAASGNPAPPPAAPAAAAPAAAGGSSSGPAATAAITPAAAPAAGAQASAGPSAGPTQAPASSPAAGSSGSSQVVTTSTSDGGQTMVIQDPGRVVNLVTNTANGQDIRLDTVVNLTLPGFDAVQRSQLLSGMGMKIGADGSFGIVSALPH